LKTTTATVPQNVLLLTTTSLPTFNLVEPEGAVASTESYLGGKVGAPLVVTQQPDSATPSVGKLGAGLHEDEKAEKAVLATSSAGDAIIQMRRQKKRRRGQTRPGAIKSTDEEVGKTETEKKVTTSDTRRTSVPRLRLKTSRPKAESPDEGRSGSSKIRRVNPYQRSRQRGVVGVSKTPEENLPGPYESKVYGLPQNPTLTDGLDETTGSGPASYIDTAISHAEVTWSQDPFRQDSFQSGEREPTFDIDFSKDPSNKIASQSKPADIGIVNLFPLKDEPSNAIDSFNKGTFVFNSPVGRSEVTSGVRRKVVVGRPVVNTEVVPQVTPHISASIKTVPRIQPARIVPQFLKEEPVPQITTIEQAPTIPIKLFDPFTFYRNL